MRNYELTVLLRPDYTSDEQQKTQEKLAKLIADLGGKVEKTDNWGRKMTAYKIGKYDEAVYVFYSVSMDPAKAQAIEQAVKLTDGVIRYLFLLADDKAGK